MSQDGIASLQTQVRLFSEAHLYDSAEVLCGLLLSRSRHVSIPSTGPGSHTLSLVLYADACFGKREYKRAAIFYRKANTFRKSGKSSKSKDPYAAEDASEDSELKFKEAQCYQQVGDSSQALRVLVSISPRDRNLSMTALLARIYRHIGLKKNAIQAYKDVLAQNCMAVEAHIALAELGVDARSIWQMVVVAGIDQEPPPRWVETLIRAHAASNGQRYAEGIDRFTELERHFPDSTHCLIQKARLQMQQEQFIEAQWAFDKALELDPDIIDHMDSYAVLLRQRASLPALACETYRLMELNQRRPESWVAAALLADFKGDRDRSLDFVQQAIQMNSYHLLAYHVKGTLLLSKGSPDAAASTLLHANTLQKQVVAYKGLISAYLALQKIKEALNAAKEANAYLPRNPQVITMLGRVLAQLPEGAEKAKEAFQRALELDPQNIDAVAALADLFSVAGHEMQAIQLLRSTLATLSNECLRAKLGQCYLQIADHDSAQLCFHEVLRIDPSHTVAIDGLDRCDKLLRAIDPDADEGQQGSAV